MKKGVFFVLCPLIFANLNAQNLRLTLDEAIYLARMSRSHQIIQIDSLINEYNHELFRINRLPRLSMSGSIPMNNSISIVTQPDGSDRFVNRFNSTANVGLSLSQLLPFTGQSISISSNLSRLDNFEPSRTTSYGFSALSISYSQPISRYNEFRWNVKSHNLRRQIDYIRHHQSIEAINQQVVDLFFNLVIEQRRVDLNKSILEFSRSVYEIARALYAERRISEEDYLGTRIEYYMALDNMNNVYVEDAKERLRNFLNMPGETQIIADFDFDILSTYQFNFNIHQVIENVSYYNRQLNNDYINLRHNQRLEQLRSTAGPTISVSLGGGFNSQSDYISFITDGMNRQMNASVSLSFPILNWGQNRIQRRILEQEMKKVYLSNAEMEGRDRSTHKRELEYVLFAVRSITRNKELMNLLKRRMELLKINVEHGRIDIQDLVRARTQLIRAEMNYVREVRGLYIIIYRYRYLSLIDIRNNTSVISSNVFYGLPN